MDKNKRKKGKTIIKQIKNPLVYTFDKQTISLGTKIQYTWVETLDGRIIQLKWQ